MELPFNPVIPLLRIYPKNPETRIQKNICNSVNHKIFKNKIKMYCKK